MINGKKPFGRKRKKYCCKYRLRREIIKKLTRNQLFWLCILALLVVGIIGVCTPAAVVGLF